METNQTLLEIKDVIENIDISNLNSSVNAIIYAWEHNNLDESDMYNLLRDTLNVVISIDIIKDFIKEV